MVYLIDDKRSRQRDYGWDDDKFSLFQEIIIPIWNYKDLMKYRDAMLEQGSVVLFHESFLSSTNTQQNTEVNSLKIDLKNLCSRLFVVFFSGSKNSRYVEDHICMLPPEVLYENLEAFLKKMNSCEIDLKVLAFGNNYNEEETLRNRLSDIIDKNIDGRIIKTEKNVLFAETKKDTIEHPFSNCVVAENWDFFPNDISDVELDDFIKNWLSTDKYDIIYIPLCFGNVYSDFLGLRLAMHIRLTETVNQNTIIIIYGVSSVFEIRQNECFDVLKLSGVYLINADNESLISYSETNAIGLDVAQELDKIQINIPSNIGNNHSLANKWAIYRWLDMLKWRTINLQKPSIEFDKSLYFKYLIAKFGKRNKFKADQKYDASIKGLSGKVIAYIDDEYDKGWELIFRYIFEECSDAKLICFKDFDKKITREELLQRIKAFIYENDADCFLIDLRLHEDDFDNWSDLSGHYVAKIIKERNPGNQIVVFTASNKVWNLKEELFRIGATGYALKESPDLNLSRNDSIKLFVDFTDCIKLACQMSYLKGLVKEQDTLISIVPQAKQLNSILNLLTKNKDSKDQDLLSAALLNEIVFLEDFVQNHLGYELLSTGEKDALRVELCRDGKQIVLTGHLFYKRIKNGKFTIVTDISEYYDDAIETPSEWCDISNSTVALVTSSLMRGLGLSRSLVKKYINFKFIRNTQIAHQTNGEKIQAISPEQIVDFYYSVISPVIRSSYL